MKVGDWVRCISKFKSTYKGPNKGDVFQVKSVWTNSYNEIYIGIEVPFYNLKAVGNNLEGIRLGTIPNWSEHIFELLSEKEIQSIEFSHKMEDIIK